MSTTLATPHTSDAAPLSAAVPEEHIRHRRPYGSVLETIGWTPMIRLARVARGIRTPLYGKADFFNPGGSVKDRVGMPMIESHERAGTLKPGGTIVEATSGNTGVGLAIAAALKGYRCIFTMPDKMSQEKVRLLKAFGAEVIITPTAVPHDHPQNYVMMAKRIVSETPGAVLAGQFENPANPAAHMATTGPEIWEQTGGKVTHFVSAMGTTGTITGVGRYLKQQNPQVRIIGAQPSEGSRIPGIRKWPEAYLPSIYDPSVVDELILVSQSDAENMCRQLAREEGIFAGVSAAGACWVAQQVAQRERHATVVFIVCDRGDRYLSTGVFPA